MELYSRTTRRSFHARFLLDVRSSSEESEPLGKSVQPRCFADSFRIAAFMPWPRCRSISRGRFEGLEPTRIGDRRTWLPIVPGTRTRANCSQRITSDDPDSADAPPESHRTPTLQRRVEILRASDRDGRWGKHWPSKNQVSAPVTDSKINSIDARWSESGFQTRGRGLRPKRNRRTLIRPPLAGLDDRRLRRRSQRFCC